MTVNQGSGAHMFGFRKAVKHLHSYDFVKLSFSVPVVSMVKQNQCSDTQNS